MYYVYALRSEKDNEFYIGSTSNLKKRLKEHNNGRVQSTSYRRPLELIYYEAYKNKEITRKREKLLKKGKARMELRRRLELD